MTLSYHRNVYIKNWVSIHIIENIALLYHRAGTRGCREGRQWSPRGLCAHFPGRTSLIVAAPVGEKSWRRRYLFGDSTEYVALTKLVGVICA